MPKLNELSGNCMPTYSDKSRATQKTLFQPMPSPKRQLEPHGNGAYEGVGYPGAGYGQKRNKVVGLAVPKVATALSAKGWEAAQPQMKMTSIFTLNPTSDMNTRAAIAPLMGLGCACSPVDHAFLKQLNSIGNGASKLEGVHGLRGLGQELSMAQKLANGIVANAVPDDIINALANKIVADEKANSAAYANVLALKRIDPNNPIIATLTRAQQNAWGQTNTAKFYALLLPEMQDRLGFTSGLRRVSPPDYKFIKSQDLDPGVFTRVADFLRDQLIGKAAQQLIAQKYMTDSTGLAGLGFAPAVIGAVAAAIAAAGILAYMVSKSSDAAQANSRAAIVAACASGRLDKAACAAAIGASSEKTDWNQIAFYGAVGIGGLVALQVISSIRSAFPSR